MRAGPGWWMGDVFWALFGPFRSHFGLGLISALPRAKQVALLISRERSESPAFTARAREPTRSHASKATDFSNCERSERQNTDLPASEASDPPYLI